MLRWSNFCSQGFGVTLCVFQTRSDEEDAENDDLNDAGEFSGQCRAWLFPQWSVGLWKWSLNIQQLSITLCTWIFTIQESYKKDSEGPKKQRI